MHATAGSLIGIGEIVLLPLDVLKIKRQTNPEAFRGRGVFRIVADEGMGLYRGAGWTAARNAPGSFAVRLSSYRPSRGELRFVNTYDSFSAVLLPQRNTCTNLLTTTPQAICKISWPLLPALQHLSSSLPL